MEFDKNESFIRCKFVTEPVVFHTLFAMEKTSLLWQINLAVVAQLLAPPKDQQKKFKETKGEK